MPYQLCAPSLGLLRCESHEEDGVGTEATLRHTARRGLRLRVDLHELGAHHCSMAWPLVLECPGMADVGRGRGAAASGSGDGRGGRVGRASSKGHHLFEAGAFKKVARGGVSLSHHPNAYNAGHVSTGQSPLRVGANSLCTAC